MSEVICYVMYDFIFIESDCIFIFGVLLIIKVRLKKLSFRVRFCWFWKVLLFFVFSVFFLIFYIVRIKK